MNCLTGSTVSDIPCCLVLLDGREVPMTVKAEDKLVVVYHRVCEMLGLMDDTLFGLRYTTPEGFQIWLSLKKPLIAQVSNASLPIRIFFGTKFYPADPCKVGDTNVRYQLYLQLRNDVQSGALHVETVLLAELCALAIQSEIGDYNATTCSSNYVSEFRFVRTQNEALESRISEVHKLLRGIQPETAEFIYLDKAKWLDTYGVFFYPTMSETIGVGVSPFGCIMMKRDVNIANRLSSNQSTAGSEVGVATSGRLSQYFWSRVTDCKRKERLLLIKTVDRENAEHVHQFVMRDKLVAKTCCSHARDYLHLFRHTHSLAAASVTGAQARRSASASRRRHRVAGGSLMIEDGTTSTASTSTTSTANASAISISDERHAEEKPTDSGVQTHFACVRQGALQLLRADAPARTSKNADCTNFARNAEVRDLSLSLSLCADGNLKDAALALAHNGSGAFDAVSDCNANAIGVSTNEPTAAASGPRNAKALRSTAGCTDEQSAQVRASASGDLNKLEGRTTADSDESDDDVHIPGVYDYDRKATEQEFIERMRRKLERHAARTRVAGKPHSASVAGSPSYTSQPQHQQQRDTARQSLAEPPTVLSHIRYDPVDPNATGWSIDDVRSIPYTHIESSGDADAAWLAQRRRIAQKYYRQRRHASGARFANSHTSQRLLAVRRGVMTESSGDETSVSRNTTRSEPTAHLLSDLTLAPVSTSTQMQLAAAGPTSPNQKLPRTAAPFSSAKQDVCAITDGERNAGTALRLRQVELLKV